MFSTNRTGIIYSNYNEKGENNNFRETKSTIPIWSSFKIILYMSKWKKSYWYYISKNKLDQKKNTLTILAMKRVLKGSAVAFGTPFGSQTAISCSSLYATCSALSRLLLSNLSSLVSTLVGGGVSLGSCK